MASGTPRSAKYRATVVGLFKNYFLYEGCNHGSRHVAGKCTVWYPIRYRQPVVENVYTGELDPVGGARRRRPALDPPMGESGATVQPVTQGVPGG